MDPAGSPFAVASVLAGARGPLLSLFVLENTMFFVLTDLSQQIAKTIQSSASSQAVSQLVYAYTASLLSGAKLQ